MTEKVRRKDRSGGGGGGSSSTAMGRRGTGQGKASGGTKETSSVPSVSTSVTASSVSQRPRPSSRGGGSSSSSSSSSSSYMSPRPLIVPITSSSLGVDPNLFIEIFPEEMAKVDAEVLIEVLKTEDAPLSTYADAALLYFQTKGGDASAGDKLLKAAVANEEYCSNKSARVRVLAAAGIASLADRRGGGSAGTAGGGGDGTDGDGGSGDAAGGGGKDRLDVDATTDDIIEDTDDMNMNTSGNSNSRSSSNSGSRSSSKKNRHNDGNNGVGGGAAALSFHTAEDLFHRALNFDQFFPMTWVGKGMLNLHMKKKEAARFFFDTTVLQYGRVLPALLGQAAVFFTEKNYVKAQELYGEAMRLYPEGALWASLRVGFGVCCYRLGQVDRARAAFRRAHRMDPDNVEAMVGCAVLDPKNATSVSGAVSDTAIKLIGKANTLGADHGNHNAMVQNHLANHFFWKWTRVGGTATVDVRKGRRKVTPSINSSGGSSSASQLAMAIAPGDHVRIGTEFETMVIADEDVVDDTNDSINSNGSFGIADVWTHPSATGLKLWKKDYDRVFSLAKSAYGCTDVKEIKAESLFLLARVYHVRGDFERAGRLYGRSIKLAPELSPARFGLAQCEIHFERHEEAAAHLRLLLMGSSSNATDALAALGLLEIRKEREAALSNLRRAVELSAKSTGSSWHGEVANTVTTNTTTVTATNTATSNTATNTATSGPSSRHHELLFLYATALQREEADYPKALAKYKEAVELMNQRKQPVPGTVWNNMGVLCQETRNYDDARTYYATALEALSSEYSTTTSVSSLSSSLPVQRHTATLDGDGTHVVLDDNALYWTYVDTDLSVASTSNATSTDADMDMDMEDDQRDESTTAANGARDKIIPTTTTTSSTGKHVLRIIVDESKPAHDLCKLKVGDHVRLGEHYHTVIVNMDEDQKELTVQDAPPSTTTTTTTTTTNAATTKDGDTTWNLSVRRSHARDRLVKNPTAVTVTFNLARLHEAAGRILAAIELHKAIVTVHPGYVNSYLRLACIARDSSSILHCSEWLRRACMVAPGNTEVMTLVGNLHLSLMDWEPAQKVFTQLLATTKDSTNNNNNNNNNSTNNSNNDDDKLNSVEAYSQLSLGNIYFNNLHTPKKYAKHLRSAAEYYKRILQRDVANAYAANGLGTILAEKGKLASAKEVFTTVREVSGDTIPDTLLNLGHIYLAQRKMPEAVKMYESYLRRTTLSGAPVTVSKSQEDHEVEVLLYLAFAYFDWAQQTEKSLQQQISRPKAADADERYAACIRYIEQAMAKSKKENVVLRYNWCRARLQAANCVLQKQERGLRRTAQEVNGALQGLKDSLPVVQKLKEWKAEGKRIPIATTTLDDYITNCRQNIESAKSHLEEELKKEKEAKALREMHLLDVQQRTEERQRMLRQQKEAERREREKRERKARDKMMRVQGLVAGWHLTTGGGGDGKTAKGKAKANHTRGPPVEAAPEVIDDDGVDLVGLRKGPRATTVKTVEERDIRGDPDDSSDDNRNHVPHKTTPHKRPVRAPEPTHKEEDLFGDSSDDDNDNSDSEDKAKGKDKGKDKSKGKDKEKTTKITKKLDSDDSEKDTNKDLEEDTDMEEEPDKDNIKDDIDNTDSDNNDNKDSDDKDNARKAKKRDKPSDDDGGGDTDDDLNDNDDDDVATKKDAKKQKLEE